MSWFTEQDQKHLGEFEKRNSKIQDGVRIIARREHPGLYVYGPGGTAKSHTVESVLKEEDAVYVFHNSQMTGPGLFGALAADPNAIHVLDDVNSIFKNEVGRQVLASAMAPNVDGVRYVERTVSQHTDRFRFFGGIIALSNRPLGRDSFSKAIASRMIIANYDPTQPELIASMKNYARTVGYENLTIDESIQVASYLIDATLELGKSIDLRLANQAAACFRTAKSGLKNDWHALVDDLIVMEQANPSGDIVPLNREEKEAMDIEIAEEIYAAAKANAWKKEKTHDVWTQSTGMSSRSYYRKLKKSGIAQTIQPSNEERRAKLRVHLGDDESQAS